MFDSPRITVVLGREIIKLLGAIEARIGNLEEILLDMNEELDEEVRRTG